MKKKMLLVLVVLFVAGAANVYALGIGVQGNFYIFVEDGDMPFLPGVSLLVSPTRNFHIAGNLIIPPVGQRTWNALGLTFDWCPDFLDFRLVGSGPTLVRNSNAWWLDLYFGIGAFTTFWFEQKGITNFDGGLRIPIGLSANFVGGFIEAFFQVVPSMGISIDQTVSPPEARRGGFFFPINIGARVWL